MVTSSVVTTSTPTTRTITANGSSTVSASAVSSTTPISTNTSAITTTVAITTSPTITSAMTISATSSIPSTVISSTTATDDLATTMSRTTFITTITTTNTTATPITTPIISTTISGITTPTNTTITTGSATSTDFISFTSSTTSAATTSAATTSAATTTIFFPSSSNSSAATSNNPAASASGSSDSNNTIIIAISIVVVILLIGIMVTILIMAWYCRKKWNSYKVYGNGAKEDSHPPPSSPPYANVDMEEKGSNYCRASMVNNVEYSHLPPSQYAVPSKKDKTEKRKSADSQRRSSIEFNYRPDRSPDLSIQSQEPTLSMVNPNYEETSFDIFSSGIPDIPERTAASHGTVFDDTEEENPIYNCNENPIYNEAINPQYIITDPSATYSAVDDRVSPYASVYADPSPLIKAEGPPIVSNKNIKRVRELGFGLFGEVVLANTKGLSYRHLGIGNSDDSSVSIKVAVKMLKASPSVDVRKSFEKEIKFMSRLKDDNVIRLLGICTTGTPFIMMEYMENGDLSKYLQKFKFTYETGRLPAANEITINALVHISYQIASGMKYLSSCNFIHRDLAARNVLVGVDHTVKIADFGMSQNLYSEYYCRVGGQKILPIRWMAYECFYGKFSVKTDVWAFGITLWEIFTLCRHLPFEDLTNQQLVDDIDKGPNRRIPIKPAICPDDIYAIMKSCWHHESSQRAKFTVLCDQLHEYYCSLF